MSTKNKNRYQVSISTPKLIFQPIKESSISLTEPEFRFNFELLITILLFIKCQYQIINTSLLFQPIRELNISKTEPDLILNYKTFFSGATFFLPRFVSTCPSFSATRTLTRGSSRKNSWRKLSDPSEWQDCCRRSIGIRSDQVTMLLIRISSYDDLNTFKKLDLAISSRLNKQFWKIFGLVYHKDRNKLSMVYHHKFDNYFVVFSKAQYKYPKRQILSQKKYF